METPCAWTFGSFDFGDAHAHKDTITLGRRVSYFAEDSMRSTLQFFVKTGIYSACSTLEQAVLIQKRPLSGSCRFLSHRMTDWLALGVML